MSASFRRFGNFPLSFVCSVNILRRVGSASFSSVHLVKILSLIGSAIDNLYSVV